MTVFEAIKNARQKGLAIELYSSKTRKSQVLNNDYSKGCLFISAYYRSNMIVYDTIINCYRKNKVVPLRTSHIVVKF